VTGDFDCQKYTPGLRIVLDTKRLCFVELHTLVMLESSLQSHHICLTIVHILSYHVSLGIIKELMRKRNNDLSKYKQTRKVLFYYKQLKCLVFAFI
jgi:hypothetical protein